MFAGTVPYQFWTRPRGAAKTADLGGIAAASMLALAPPGARLYAAAADRDQAGLFIDSIRGYVSRTPGLVDVLAG